MNKKEKDYYDIREALALAEEYRLIIKSTRGYGKAEAERRRKEEKDNGNNED